MKKKVTAVAQGAISRYCGSQQSHFISKIYLKGMRIEHCELDFTNTWVPLVLAAEHFLDVTQALLVCLGSSTAPFDAAHTEVLTHMMLLGGRK